MEPCGTSLVESKMNNHACAIVMPKRPCSDPALSEMSEDTSVLRKSSPRAPQPQAAQGLNLHNARACSTAV